MATGVFIVHLFITHAWLTLLTLIACLMLGNNAKAE